MARAVPIIGSQAAGNYLTGALWNVSVKAMADWLLGAGTNGVPRFRGYQTSVQALSDNTWTPLNFDSETFDSDNGHSTSSNTSRYVVQVPGTYAVLGHASFAANATGNRAARVNLNGVAIPGSFVKTLAATASHSSAVACGTQAVCVVGDYLEIHGLHTAGAALNTSAGTDVACAMNVWWISG
ncbi:hypothetical protein ABTZ78_17520 [Streptomyces bauhiniae]|uniref:hypothetical protein n=1 Tax=Streptomyces bauhiniae TaxID=2340725 RepID=UPI0033334B90